MHQQHMTLCYEYKNATSLEETNVCYIAIWHWRYSTWAIDVARLQKLENWFIFCHFHVKQWGSFMIHITFSSLPCIFHPIQFRWHVYNML